MRLTIERTELADIVGRGTSVAPKNSATVPVLTSARLVASRGTLSVTSTNLAQTVEATGGAEVEAAGDLLVNAARLKATVDRLQGDKPVSVTLDGRELVVKAGRSRVRMPVAAGQDFPEWDTVKGGVTMRVEVEPLAKLLATPLIAAALPSASAVFQSVYLHMRAWGDRQHALCAAGTNGHLFFVSAMELPAGGVYGDDLKALIPVEAAAALAKLFRGEKAITVTITPNKIAFVGDGTRMVSKLVEGTFPPYERILESPGETAALFDRDRAAAAVGLLEASMDGDEGRWVECAAVADGLAFGSFSAGGKAVDVVDAELTGTMDPVGFTSSYLRAVLGAFKTETLQLVPAGPRPALFFSEHEPDLVAALATVSVGVPKVAKELAHEPA